ncbi:MAG: hypothetical protein ACRESZ_13480 [Methylococcales bacterium]
MQNRIIDVRRLLRTVFNSPSKLFEPLGEWLGALDSLLGFRVGFVGFYGFPMRFVQPRQLVYGE